MKLKSISIKNLKGVDEFEREFDQTSKVFLIKGPNGIGKTTLLQVLQASLSREKKMGLSEPIRAGIESGGATVEFIDEYGKTVSFEYSAKKTPSGRTSEKLEMLIGGVKADPKLIDQLYGEAPTLLNLSEFIRNQGTKSGRAKNASQIFQGLFGIDLEAHEQAIQKAQGDVSDLSAKVKQLQPIIEDTGLSASEIVEFKADPAESTQSLEEELRVANVHNAEIDGRANEMKSWMVRMERVKAIELSAREKVDRLTNELEKAKQEQSEAVESLKEANTKYEEVVAASLTDEKIDTSEIVEKIQDFKAAQARAANLERLKPKAEELIQAQVKLGAAQDAKAKALIKKTKAVSAAVKEAGLPPFMKFRNEEDGGTILYYIDDNTGPEGVPFEEGQVRRSAMVSGSAALFAVMAKETAFPVVLIEDAGLLDSKHQKQLFDFCNDLGFQVIAEIVTDTEQIEIEITS